ncbi:MAG: hypothetical protein KKC55_14840 [Gammaproteobacteria bacterium]|uniref:Uncharacterized protein n=1 Tax=viral metagenome TaxID=1070528 RepID=A0A6M3X7K9_9ZZZZ|nr:hypothetical protein [Gammaproteobacteria bacterium]
MRFIQAEPTPGLEKWAKEKVRLNIEEIVELQTEITVLQRENDMLQEFLDICNSSLKKFI